MMESLMEFAERVRETFGSKSFVYESQTNEEFVAKMREAHEEDTNLSRLQMVEDALTQEKRHWENSFYNLSRERIDSHYTWEEDLILRVEILKERFRC